MDAPIIELSDVVKSFGPVSVLKGVSLNAYPGKVTALVGDNGAGKSTLIKGLAGVQPYDSGTVKFDGTEVHLHTPREAARLGIE
ncbi:MAG: ATP-binding cassette domain-containing protein, partial [Leifsonia sp.]